MKNIKILHRTFFGITMVIILSACGHTVIEQQSQINLPIQFEQVQAGENNLDVQQWWNNWQDPTLSLLITQGLAKNLDLALAQSRLREAQANFDYAEADRGINVLASSSGNTTLSHIKVDSQHNRTSFESGNIYGGISASWELDFWGKKRSDADMAQSLMLAQQEELYATQLLITKQIAENYFRMQAIELQAHLIQQTIQTWQHLERYIKGRFNAGQSTAYEVNEISNQITREQARIAILQANRDYYQRQIAILLGEAPEHFIVKITLNSLNKVPSVPTGQQPSHIIERRPDLRSASHHLDAQTAKLASAKADLYPRFNLTFMGQGGYIKLDNDLSNISGLASIAKLDIQLPIFTNGRIQANIDAVDAKLKTAVIRYDKLLLTALAEVENAYQHHYALSHQVHLITKNVRQLNQQVKDAQVLFNHNQKSLDVVIRAKISTLNQQEQLIQTRLALALNWLDLYSALGGGWKK